jgi:hypothetical protein
MVSWVLTVSSGKPESNGFRDLTPRKAGSETLAESLTPLAPFFRGVLSLPDSGAEGWADDCVGTE